MPYTILKNLYGPKMDAILTISFKITAEIEIRKHIFASFFADKVYRLCKAYVILFIRCHEMHLHCCFFFFTVNTSVNASRSY